MIPILYECNETAFLSNGICRLPDIIDGTVTEELNGIYECEFKYPVNGRNYSEIFEGRIIAVFHDDTKTIQPFDIYGRSVPINGLVTFYAHHISYRLSRVVTTPFSADNSVDAFRLAFENRLNGEHFFCDVEHIPMVYRDFEITVPSILREVLCADSDSLLYTYGQDYEFDKFELKFNTRNVIDVQRYIYYGKNLMKMVQDIDDSETYNAAVPFWKSSSDDEAPIKTLPDYGMIFAPELGHQLFVPVRSSSYITSEYKPFYVSEKYYIRAVPLDLSDYFDTEPTDRQLWNKAKEVFEKKEGWLPNENISIDFTQEAIGTEMFKDLRLGNYIEVINTKSHLFRQKIRVIKTVYNFVKEKYSSIEVGTPKKNLAEEIRKPTDSYNDPVPTDYQIIDIDPEDIESEEPIILEP